MSDSTQPLPLSQMDANVDADLGIGAIVSARHDYRLLNRDGSFNVKVLHGPVVDRFISFNSLLTMSWVNFSALMVIGFVALNVMFALAFLACGPNALSGDGGPGFWRAFFFSVDTLATIGYGNITPATTAANLIVSVEALAGLSIFALGTGLVFARFARPIPDIVYSKTAVIGPYRDGMGFKFRVANRRRTQLVNVEALVMHSRFERKRNGVERKYHQLNLEREMVAFFPLNWTIVHPIDESSPLYGWTAERLREAEAEFYILLTGVDEAFAQTVHSRSSYSADEVQFGKTFKMMYYPEEGHFVMDLDLLDATEDAQQSD